MESLDIEVNTPLVHRDWSTGLFNIFSDEESCWWGTWCACFLAGRDTATFGLGTSYRQIILVVIGIIVICYTAGLEMPVVPFAVAAAGGLVYTIYRTFQRMEIRRRYSIIGTPLGDAFLHLLCFNFAICQEAREAKHLNLKKLDYFTGQDMEELNPAIYEASLGLGGEAINERPKLWSTLSGFSKWAVCTLGLGFLVLVVCLAGLAPNTALVLLLTFLQPAIALYLVYWVYAKQYAQLDYVIKLFIVGFFMSTTQSIILEEIVQLLFGMVVIILIDIFDPTSLQPSTASDISFGAKFLSQIHGVSKTRPLLSATYTGQDIQNLINSLISPREQVTAANALQVDRYRYHADSSLTNAYLHEAEFNMTAADDGVMNVSAEMARRNFWIILLLLFVTAFVIAAGVEETMKHFAVRCCRFPAALKDPKTVLVYLFAAAAGFTTAENLEYIFAAVPSTSPEDQSVLEDQIIVWFFRILMPIHLICSFLQAAQLAQVVTGMRNMHMVSVLMPAVFLHGIFDYFLFVVGAIQTVYKVDTLALDIIAGLFPFLITIAGVIWAYVSFGSVSQAMRVLFCI